ncbi:MAG: effector binding domain-containing protein [Coprobacillus sp.]
MEAFRIEKKESFRVIGYSIVTTNKRKEGRKAVPIHWENFLKQNKQDILLSLINQEPYGLLGINVYNINQGDSRIFRYYIAVPSDEPIQDELDEYIVPAMTWAVFPCTRETIGKTEAQAITKWLPRSKYRPLNSGYITGRMKSLAPDIEYYNKDGNVEVWVAVEEK